MTELDLTPDQRRQLDLPVDLEVNRRVQAVLAYLRL